MNRLMLSFGACALIATLGLSGCGKEESAPKAPEMGGAANGSAPSSIDATKDAAKSAASDLSKQASAAWEKAKASLTTEGESALTSVGASIESLKARSAQIPAETKAAYDTAMKELTTQFDSVKSEFAKLKDSAEGSWDKVSADFQKSLGNLKDAVNQAMKQFGAGS